MSEELLNCPFCGGEAALMQEMHTWYAVSCVDCECRTPLSDAKTVVRIWNTRAERTCDFIEVAPGGTAGRCGKCGTMLHYVDAYCSKCGCRVRKVGE